MIKFHYFDYLIVSFVISGESHEYVENVLVKLPSGKSNGKITKINYLN